MCLCMYVHTCVCIRMYKILYDMYICTVRAVYTYCMYVCMYVYVPMYMCLSLLTYMYVYGNRMRQSCDNHVMIM